MRYFSRLYEQLDATTSTNAKVAALVDYFRHVPAGDAAWAVYFLCGRRIKRLVGRTPMKRWLVEASGMEEWLAEDSYSAVGDLAETVSLLVEEKAAEQALADQSLATWMTEHILPLKDLDEAAQGAIVQGWWQSLPTNLCYLVTKLLTGALRVGVSQTLVARALAEYANLPRAVILHRLMGDWKPTADFFTALIDPDTQTEDNSRPYPFYLASPLDKAVDELGSVTDWQVEWKWDGIRAQLIRRNGETFIWSRGEELVTHRFPEVADAAAVLPDGSVLDGEILAWQDNVLPFSALQRRLGRKNVSKKMLAEVPVRFLAYDCMEFEAQDIRQQALHVRRRHLERLINHSQQDALGLSPLFEGQDWKSLARARVDARANRVEGLMLKHRDSIYGTGRQKGDWWKWKVDPLTIDAVMIYAQAGHGRRATLFTDYTFAVWQEDKLLPIAKAYSGLDDKEINKLDKWIRSNTIERFGPVRSVKPEHVFELGFEGINASNRHKSGVALRFPRILRWRSDMRPQDANTLSQVKELLHVG